jgi:Flp pilus assembly protein TadD
MALKLGMKDNASFAMALRAVYEAYLGKPAQARESAKAALKLSHMSDTIEPVAVALAVVGDEKQSQALIDKLAKRRPQDTSVRFVWVPLIQAIAKQRHGDFEGALHLVAAGTPYDRGNLDSMFWRANALLQARHGSEAAEEFRRLANLRKGFPADPAGALAVLGLGWAYMQMGDASSGRSCYEEFRTLWKDADSDLPVLKQATVEFSMLN